MILTHINLEHPHLAKYYTKKYYNKLYGTKFRSLKVISRYSRQIDRRAMEEWFEAPMIRPMDPPSDKIYYMPL